MYPELVTNFTKACVVTTKDLFYDIKIALGLNIQMQILTRIAEDHRKLMTNQLKPVHIRNNKTV